MIVVWIIFDVFKLQVELCFLGRGKINNKKQHLNAQSSAIFFSSLKEEKRLTSKSDSVL